MTTHPLPTDLLITYSDSVLFGLTSTVQICWHVAALTYDKNILLPFKLHTSRNSLSLAGSIEQEIQEALWRSCRTLTAPIALSFPLWS